MGPRLTVDEKRKRLLEIFHETSEPYLLKELEKIGPKQKGIVSQSVKDVLQSLVDDSLCHCEKIGTSNYFWSFPSEQALRRRNRIEELRRQISQAEAKNAELEASIEQAMLGRENTDERVQLLAELAEVEAKCEGQRKELRVFEECDPKVLGARRAEAVVARDAANRWTDNVFIMQSWMREKFNIETSQFEKYFGIPADFDNV
ncbi:Meiotic nuclear division protein 1 [Coemansia sp. Benny D115]|nr:Meiotic nuclear division protein 1 [Coemansia sp. Benny D115]